MRVEAGVVVVTVLCVAGGLLCHAANTTTWSTFLHHYIQAYTYNTVCFFVPTNESAWRRWVWAVIPGVARQTSAYIAVREDMSEAQLWGRTLAITPLWTEQHAAQLSQWLSRGTMDNLRWLVVAQRNFSNLASLVYFPILNQATLAVQEGEEVNVWEIYQIDEDWRQRVELMGWWRPGLPPVMELPPEDVVPRRTNLTGLHLRCLTLESQPSTFSQLTEDGTVQVLGWFADVWREMQRLSNFTYECRHPADQEWGAPKASVEGGWTGMVGELAQGLADVIVAPLDHTQARSTVVDFCMGLRISGYHLVMRRSTTDDSMWTSFTREFQWQVWLVVGVCLLLGSFVFYATGFSPVERETITLGDAFLMAYGSLCAQSTSLALTSTSARIAFITIYLNTMLLYAFYTCFIISHLAIKPCGRPFDTMQEMFDQGHKYRLGFVKGISVEESFKLASGGLYQDVWKQLVEPHYSSLVRTDEQGINRALQDPRYVHFMAENKFLFKYAHNCDLVKIPHRYMEIASTFAVPKGSPLRRIFTYHMMRLRDTGIIHRHWRRWRPRDSVCDTVDSLQAFTLYNLLTVFLMLGTLAGLAMVMLGCERVAAMWERTSLVTTVETNTSWTRLHHQLTRMTLHVFKVQTTVTTTLVRALNQQEAPPPAPTTNDSDDNYTAGNASSEPEGVTALVDREH